MNSLDLSPGTALLAGQAPPASTDRPRPQRHLPTTRQVGMHRELPGNPAGWFAVAYSRELKPGGKLTRQLIGHEVLLYRTQGGVAHALNPYCPHLGAHLGQAGRVEGQNIRCLFHGFCFNGQGACVATGYGTKPPPLARVQTWPLQEVNGLLFLYYDPLGKQPLWEIPQFPQEGWTPFKVGTWQVATHPQETTENSVDLGHFAWTHHYTGVEVLNPQVMDGPRLRAKYAVKRPAGTLGGAGGNMRCEFTIEVWGLGFSLVEVHIPACNLTTRQFVCATLVEPGVTDVRVGLSVRSTSHPGRVHPLLGVFPRRLATALIRGMAYRSFIHDLQQDFPFWAQKTYLVRPALAKGDGPIGSYRHWTSQFYPHEQSSGIPLLLADQDLAGEMHLAPGSNG